MFHSAGRYGPSDCSAPMNLQWMQDPDNQDGKYRVRKRCQSYAPQHGDQCTKRLKHNKTDRVVVHQNGSLVWGEDEQSHAHVTPKSWSSFPGMTIDPEFINTPRLHPGHDSIHAQAEAFAMAQGLAKPLGLEEWWRQLSEREIEATVPKAIEYGATDLIDIGVQLGTWMKRPLTDAHAAELGCWFYLIGKIARATSAIGRGDQPSDDTIKDIGVYIKMIQRIRAAGGWPGEELNDGDSFQHSLYPE